MRQKLEEYVELSIFFFKIYTDRNGPAEEEESVLWGVGRERDRTRSARVISLSREEGMGTQRRGERHGRWPWRRAPVMGKCSLPHMPRSQYRTAAFEKRNNFY